MRIPKLKWEHITMDFVIRLPMALGKLSSVWVIVDRLTKLAHFLPVRISYSADQLAKIYIRELVRLHRVRISTMLDWGSMFTSHKGLTT